MKKLKVIYMGDVNRDVLDFEEAIKLSLKFASLVHINSKKGSPLRKKFEWIFKRLCLLEKEICSFDGIKNE